MSGYKFVKGIGIGLIAAVMTTCVACGQGGASAPSNTPTVSSDVELNIKDYADEFEYNKARTAVTSTTNLTKLRGAKFVSSQDGLIYYRDPTGYGAYNLRKDKVILSGLSAQPVLTTLAGISVLRTNRTTGGEIVYDYTSAVDGTKLLTDCLDYYPTAGKYKLTISGDTVKSEILALSASVLRGGEREYVQKYFKIERDELTDKIIGLTGVLGSGFAADEGYETGKDYNALSRNPVYEDDAEHEIEGAIAEYSYGIYGNSYVFYNGEGKETGSVRLSNSEVLGFVSNYMYYVTGAPVYPEATSGFNFITSNNKKFSYTLNRYDIINNVASTVAFDAVITDFKPLYNSTKKAYDAVVVRGYGFSNGVAYSGYNEFCHLTDDQLRSAYDLDRLNNPYTPYALGNENYYFGGYIVDGQLNGLTAASAFHIYPEQGLVAIKNDSGWTGFADFSGKIVMTPEFKPDTDCADYSPGEPIKFYGDRAYLLKSTNSGEAQKVLIDKTGVVENLSDKEQSGSSKTVEITVYGGFYLTLTTDLTTSRAVYTYEFTSFNGTKIHTVTRDTSDSIACVKVGDAFVIIDSRSGDTAYYKVG